MEWVCVCLSFAFFLAFLSLLPPAIPHLSSTWMKTLEHLSKRVPAFQISLDVSRESSKTMWCRCVARSRRRGCPVLCEVLVVMVMRREWGKYHVSFAISGYCGDNRQSTIATHSPRVRDTTASLRRLMARLETFSRTPKRAVSCC